jgi:hypothetical protein
MRTASLLAWMHHPVLIPASVVLGAALALAQPGCQQQGFRCGVAVESQEGTIASCARTLEVCVCETNLCAMQVSPRECPSGLKYIEQPFVPESLAQSCVTSLLYPGWLVRSGPGSNHPLQCSEIDMGASLPEDM